MILSMLYAGAPQPLQQMFEAVFQIDVSFPKETFFNEQSLYNNNLMIRAKESPPQSPSFIQRITRIFRKQVENVSTRFVYQIANACLRHENVAPNIENIRHGFDLISFKDVEEATEKANHWVDKTTEGKITDLVKNLDPSTVFMLVTTAMFGGKWTFPFDPSKTQKRNFYNANGTTVSIETMSSGSDNLRYGDLKYSFSLFDILELPFHDNIAMVVVHPQNMKTAPDDLKLLMGTADGVQNLIDYISSDKFKPRKGLKVQIPKVHFQDETDLIKDLNWPLMDEIKKADFNGSLVMDKNNTSKPITTNTLVSRSHFNMDERGVKLTATSYSPTGFQSCDPQCLIHSPFAYLLYDQETKTILGCGQVLNLEGDPGKNFNRI